MKDKETILHSLEELIVKFIILDSWNDYSKLSKTNINHVITPKVMRLDDKAVQNIKKRITKE